MCTRVVNLDGEDYVQFFKKGKLVRQVRLVSLSQYAPRKYNLGPRHSLPVIREVDDAYEEWPTPWGFFGNAGPGEKAPLLLNARIETALTLRTFSKAMQVRRATVPVSAFYEFQKIGAARVPFLFQLRSKRKLLLAALYEADDDGAPTGFVVMTTTPNAVMAPIHNRMPVVLSEQNLERWIEPGPMTDNRLAEFLVPRPAEEFECYRVGSVVNDVRNESPECVVPWVEDSEFRLE